MATSGFLNDPPGLSIRVWVLKPFMLPRRSRFYARFPVPTVLQRMMGVRYLIALLSVSTGDAECLSGETQKGLRNRSHANKRRSDSPQRKWL